MLKCSKHISFVVVLFFILLSKTVYGAWVQSEHQGMTIRHPKGWQVSWEKNQVTVTHPQNPNIWCEVRKYSGSGTSQQFTYSMLNNLHSRVQGLKVVTQAQVHRAPDIFGVKFSYQLGGVLVGSVMLTATSDGREFVTHCYAAPAQVYDRTKLTLIPILASFGFEGGGSPGKATGNVQILRAPGGSWAYKVPPGWQVVPYRHPSDETYMAAINGPNGQFVDVQSGSGNSMNFTLQQQKYGAQPPLQSLRIPYMSAADLFGYIVEPHLQMQTPGANRQITNLKPVSVEIAQYTVAVTLSGYHFVEEGLLKNSPMPCTGSHDDLNLFTLSRVAAPAEHFPKVRDQLWQIVSSFEAIPEFGVAALSMILQHCAKMRQENIQALSNMAMRNIRTNQKIMRDTVGTTIRMGEQRRQEGEAWHRVFSGHEIAQDPTTGKRYEVPVGGQYIYGNPATGRVIRSDGPISQNELPTGFSQLEAASVYDKK